MDSRFKKSLVCNETMPNSPQQPQQKKQKTENFRFKQQKLSELYPQLKNTKHDCYLAFSYPTVVKK